MPNRLLERVRWPGREPLPVEAGPSAAVLARTFLYLYGAGGTLAVGSLAVPHTGLRSTLAVALPGVAALAVGLVMLLAFDRIPLRWFRALPPLGTVLASIVVWGGGEHLMVPYAGFYFWVVLSSFYLFDVRWAWVNVAFVGTAFATVLVLTPHRPDRLLSWVMVMGALAVGGAMIGLLRTRLERLLEEFGHALQRTREGEHALAEAQRIAAIGSWELDLRTRELTGSQEFRRTFGLPDARPVAIDEVRPRIHAADRDHMRATLSDAVARRGAVEFEARVVIGDGIRYIHVRGQVVARDGRPAKIVGTAQDITERKLHQERLQRTLRRLAATTDIALALGSDTELGGLLKLIAERTRSLLDAPAVAIFVASADGLQRAVTVGEGPVVADDAVGHVEPETLARGQGHRLDGALAVPLVFRGDFHGLLLAADRGSESFSHDDEEMLHAFAASAATAVAAAKSVQQDTLRRSIEASERERARWAHELHDQTLQSLSVLQMRLQLALGGGPEALTQAAEAALEQIASEVANLRRIIADLRPAVLDDFGLVPALELLVERTRQAYGLAVETRIAFARDDERRLGAELEQTVYRLIQEALVNVCKHAQARSATVALTAVADDVVVCVEDDGCGFDTAAHHNGFGLSGMRERVRLADGRLSVESRPGGTRIEAVLPIARTAALTSR